MANSGCFIIDGLAIASKDWSGQGFLSSLRMFGRDEAAIKTAVDFLKNHFLLNFSNVQVYSDNSLGFFRSGFESLILLLGSQFF